jgi:N-acetylmuramoyl-L-alanine amidase
MANVDRIKRQLLRDLVQQNVELAEGRLPKTLRRGRRWPPSLRVAAAAALSLALLGSSGLIASRRQAAESPEASPPRPGTVRPVSAAAVSSPVAFTSPPQPVDAAVFPLAVRKVVIDAGHGGASTGTRTPEGTLEKDLTLDIAERLQRLLAGQAFQVVMTREADRDVSLKERGGLANRVQADIFVSIHLNWIANRRSGGLETYYMGPTDDPELTRLVASENRESGYSLTDMRRLLDRIYAGVRQEKSRKLAETVQGALFQTLGKVSPAIENRGVKTAPFIVLLTTDMPAILAEVSSLSNADEARLLTKPLYRQSIAEALAQGIRAYAASVEEPELNVAARKESQ